MKDRCSFENYIVAENSRAAYELLADIAGACPHCYEPVFLNGPTGSGKTHLLFALCNATQAQGKAALYQSAEDFVTALIGAIWQKRQDAFYRSFKVYTLVVIDDIQFLSQKPNTLEELFHFTRKIGESAQIVLAGSFESLSEGTHGGCLVERLCSHIPNTVLAQLAPPSCNERTIMLENFLRNKEIALRRGRLVKLARKRPTMRQLEGVANSIRAGNLLTQDKCL